MTSAIRLPRPVKTRLYHPFLYQQGNAKNILLFSSRRGGSTLLEQIITCNRGFRSIDQPFDLFTPHTEAGKIKAKFLPDMYWSQFISLSDSEECQVKHYMSLALSGQLRLLGGIERWDFPILGHRTFMKILNASPLIDWFSQNFEVKICYLMRHPIPQSLSVMQNKWGITADAYLKNSHFVESYLNLEQVNLAEYILENGDYFQQAVLNWVFENLVPLKYAKESFSKIAYENLILDSDKIITMLSNELDLPEIEGMSREVARPSRSAKFSGKANQKNLKDRDPKTIISNWMKKVSSIQINQVDQILNTFEIQDYLSDSPFPNNTFNSI
jgi:hypothetical protein